MTGTRRALLAIGLAVGVALAPAAPAFAKPKGLCPKPYPNPRISLYGTAVTAQRGTPVTFAGHITRNSCPLPGMKLGFYARESVGPFTYVGEQVSNAMGAYTFTRNAARSYDVMVLMSKTGLYARTESRVYHVTVTEQKAPTVVVLSGCHLPANTPIGIRPPTGMRVDLVLPERSVRAGNWLQAAVKITNYLNVPQTIDEIEGARAAILRNIKTGELATPTYFSSVNRIVKRTIQPRRTITLSVPIKTVTCEDPVLGPRIAAGKYDVIASVQLTWQGIRTTWVPEVEVVTVTS